MCLHQCVCVCLHVLLSYMLLKHVHVLNPSSNRYLLHNRYVVTKLASSYFRPTPNNKSTQDTFSKTTLLIVAMTTLFLITNSYTIFFYIVNTVEHMGGPMFFENFEIKPWIYTKALLWLFPCFYPALNPIIHFMGTDRNRQRLSGNVTRLSLLKTSTIRARFLSSRRLSTTNRAQKYSTDHIRVNTMIDNIPCTPKAGTPIPGTPIPSPLPSPMHRDRSLLHKTPKPSTNIRSNSAISEMSNAGSSKSLVTGL